MKKLILLSVLLSSQAWANCNVHIPQREFDYAGYSIGFNFDNLLRDKGYFEIDDSARASFILKIEGIVKEGTFQKAITKVSLADYKAETSILCLTQNCALDDFMRSFNKSLKKLKRKLPQCR